MARAGETGSDDRKQAVRMGDLELQVQYNQDTIAALVDVVARKLGIDPDEFREDVEEMTMARRGEVDWVEDGGPLSSEDY